MSIKIGSAVITTITLNPCMDRTINVYGLVLDEPNRWTSANIYAGGKGIDVSRAVHAMGGNSVAYSFTGGPAGRVVEILLDEEGVPFNFTPIKQETRTNFIITDTKTSQQTRIDAPGPHISKGELERLLRKIKQIYPKPDLMFVGGSVPPGVPDNIYYHLILEAKARGIKAILDATGRWLKEGIKAKPFLTKSNVYEAAELFGTQLDTEEATIKAALSLVKEGVEIAVISRGKDGLMAATKERICGAVPPPVKVRSALGAGDCVAAGLALKLAHGAPLIEACRLATAMGTAAVLTPGNELCHKADVETLLPSIRVEEAPIKKPAEALFAISD